jgi:hypothetical protein
MIARHTYDPDDRARVSAPQRARRRERREPESPCRRTPAWPGWGEPGAVPVVPPETRDVVGIVSAIDVPERIRDQLEVE